MKQVGLFGKGTGKLGSAVFAISGGEQIVREYNPKVANPNTDAQVEQRAKFKLLSQVAASLYPIIGFTKMGLVSARNQFVKKNFPFTTIGVAKDARITLEELVLTPGNQLLTGLEIPDTSAELTTVITFESDPSLQADLYLAALITTEDDKLSIVDKKMKTAEQIVTEHGITLTGVSGNNLAVIYGIKYGSVANSVRFTNYAVDAIDEDAYLNTFKSLIKSGAICTANTNKIITLGS